MSTRLSARKNSRNGWRWLNVLALIAMLVVNYLSNALPLGGRTTEEISDAYPVLVTPAGYVFPVIWGLIYLLLIAFVIYQALPANQNRESVRKTDGLFVLSCLLNILWLFLWHYDYIYLSVLVIIGLLLTLIALYVRVRSVPGTPTLGEKLWVRLPFSLYLAWVSVATIVNISIALYRAEWDGFGIADSTWAVIVLTLGALIALAVSFKYRDPAFVAVFVWAYIGIAVKQQDHKTVFVAALVLAVLLFLYMLTLLPFGRRTITIGGGRERAK
ncbi:TspO/MBR family protein [Gorillibacterium sp. CAU 1737]|uniref:TspO/MBR family protein n=1 Tax=Gorillibacterium sp. CAU 1737 TaxID=3140362 RepID=UPI0032611CB6